MDKNRRRTGRLGRRTPGVRWGLCLASLAEQETAPHPHGTTASMMAKTIVEHQKLCGGEFSLLPSAGGTESGKDAEYEEAAVPCYDVAFAGSAFRHQWCLCRRCVDRQRSAVS